MNTNLLISLWNHTQQHPGTSGARACAQVLLGLYNGARFPMDLTDLRVLDKPLREAALSVITHDATACQREVHEWLNLLAGRRDMGDRFEALAWEYNCFKRGRCKRDELTAGIGRFAIAAHAWVPEDGEFGAPQLAGRLGNLKIIENESVPQGEAHVVQDGKVIGRGIIVDELYGNTTDEIVKALGVPPQLLSAGPRFDIDAHHRAMMTPFFNDLAG